MKEYKIHEAVNYLKAHGVTKVSYDSLARQLHRDLDKLAHARKFPHAHKMKCCGAWQIPEIDLK
jgi:hypothetical protein